jgi:hypothetical protein
MSESNGKSKAELIDEKLMGLEIIDGDNDYGVIVRITQTNGEFKVYTNLGHSFNAGLILNLLALSNLHERAAEKAANNEDDNVTYLSPAYRENARISSDKVVSKPRPMAHSKQMRMNGTINNTAKFNDEEINITSYVSSGESFPEESK